MSKMEQNCEKYPLSQSQRKEDVSDNKHYTMSNICEILNLNTDDLTSSNSKSYNSEENEQCSTNVINDQVEIEITDNPMKGLEGVGERKTNSLLMEVVQETGNLQNAESVTSINDSEQQKIDPLDMNTTLAKCDYTFDTNKQENEVSDLTRCVSEGSNNEEIDPLKTESYYIREKDSPNEVCGMDSNIHLKEMLTNECSNPLEISKTCEGHDISSKNDTILDVISNENILITETNNNNDHGTDSCTPNKLNMNLLRNETSEQNIFTEILPSLASNCEADAIGTVDEITKITHELDNNAVEVKDDSELDLNVSQVITSLEKENKSMAEEREVIETKMNLSESTEISAPSYSKIDGFKCCICDFTTTHENVMKTHVETDHDEAKGVANPAASDVTFPCGHCLTVFKTYDDLEKHTDCTNKKDNANYESCKAHISNANRGMIKKVIKDNKKMFKCDECNYTSNQRANLYRHIVTIHNFKCTVCDFVTASKSVLNSHILDKHSVSKTQADFKENASTLTKKSLQSFKCKECNFRTPIPATFIDHMNDNHSKEKTYQCEKCAFECSYMSSLRRHIKRFHMGKNLKCKFCSTVFKNYFHLQKHIKADHDKEDFDTNQMESETITKDINACSNFDDSIENVDEPENEESDTDSSTTSCKSNLNMIDKRSCDTKHTKKRDNTENKCKFCDYKAKNGYNLLKHVNKVHDDLKNFKCKECDFATFYAGNLARHIQRHHKNKASGTSIVNQTKGKEIRKTGRTIKNIIDINGDEDYVSRNKNNLQMHINAIHENVKNYKCKNCGYGTLFKSNLNKHIKQCHSPIASEKMQENNESMSYDKGDHNITHPVSDDDDDTDISIDELEEGKIEQHPISAKEQKTDDQASSLVTVENNEEMTTNIVVQCGDSREELAKKYENNDKNDQSDIDYVSKTDNLKESDSDNKGKLACSLCSYKATRRVNLSRHIKVVHEHPKYSKKKKTEKKRHKNKQDKKTDPKILKQMSIKCKLCEHVAENKTKYGKHITEVHKNGNKCKCLKCDFETTNFMNFVRHVQNNHKDELPIHEYKPRWSKHRKSPTVLEKGKKTLKCTYCGYVPKLKKHLKRHINAVHKNLKNFKCKECNYESAYDSGLKNHMLKQHNKTEVTCDKGDENRPKRVYKCNYCKDFSTKELDSLEEHMKNVHGDKKEFMCNECGFMTFHDAILQNHMQQHHSKDTNEDNKQGDERSSNREVLLACSMCDDCTTSKSRELNEHMESEHDRRVKIKCTECYYQHLAFSQVSLHFIQCHVKQSVANESNQANAKVRYKCKKCQYEAKHEGILDRHYMLCHTPRNTDQSEKVDDVEDISNDSMEFECKICDFKTTSNNNLIRHIAEKHDMTVKEKISKLQEFKCTKCNYLAQSYYMLAKHTIQTHEQVNQSDMLSKEFNCSECDFKGATQGIVDWHKVRRHNKTFRCNLCDYQTFFEKDLLRHTAIKHDEYETEESGLKRKQPLTSTDTVKKCKTVSDTVKKAKAASNNVKKAKTSSKNGKMAKSEESLHKCTFCKFETEYSDLLMKHIRISHPSRNNIRCGLCNFSSKSREDVTKHMNDCH